jgi:hypothetical protein
MSRLTKGLLGFTYSHAIDYGMAMRISRPADFARPVFKEENGIKIK